MKGYIPSNLNLSAEKHPDKYYYILTLLYYGSIFDKRNKSYSFIQLDSMFLKSIIGGRYKQYLQRLIDLKIIETDNHYIVNVKFKGYRLTEKYRSEKAKQIEIKNEFILRNVNLYNNKKKQGKGIQLNQHRYIYECLKQVTINYEEAKYFIESNITNIDKYVAYNSSINLIDAKYWFFTVDETAGRVHNNITNLSRNLRPYLRYKKQKLVEIDITNSQPFLFNILINQYLSSYSISEGNTESSIILSYVHPDVELYRDLTMRGMFYKYLMNSLGINEDSSTFKVRFFSKVFFSRENPKYVYAERKQFKKLFPNVSIIITHYKKDDYKNLAISLQRVEADIMINTIVPRLAQEGIYCLTIHDSILTTKDKVEQVKEIILDEFKMKYNLIPTVRIK